MTSISLIQWLNMWGRLTYGSAGLSDFPCWVQTLPQIFFKVIDRDGEDRGTLTLLLPVVLVAVAVVVVAATVVGPTLVVTTVAH